jgi:ectoine hydroxylase-related dioxygenase (phytanoyl-CoA dioxygenase family)
MTHRQDQFARHGFVLERVLTDAEVEDFRRLMAELLDPTKKTASNEVACSSMQHLGDPLESFGTRAKQYYIHMLGTPRATSILHAYHIPAVLEIVEELLGPQPIINNASIFATNPGVSYSLGWHRDIIQIPQNEIRDELFSPEWPHNSVQINLPLYEEQSLWVVPGSHRRPNTPDEDAAFGGSKHYAPTDAVMPGGVPVKIPAGHALLQQPRGDDPRSPLVGEVRRGDQGSATGDRERQHHPVVVEVGVALRRMDHREQLIGAVGVDRQLVFESKGG